MRRLISVLFAAVLVAGAVCAEPTKQAGSGGMSNQSFGEGGGYTHPTPEVGGYMESDPTRRAVAPEHAPARVQRAAPAVAPAKARPAVESVSLDAASENARRDYETRLLGAGPEAVRPSLAADKKQSSIAAVPTEEGSLFVSLDLDPEEAGSLRDAVAGLSAAASFKPDMRFTPTPGVGRSVRISGWLPVSRLWAVVARPGIKRVTVERSSRPSATSLNGDFMIGLRVADAAHSEESIAALVKDLTERAGFKIQRVYGVQSTPNGGSVAFVAGNIPLSRLSSAMGLPNVVKISALMPPAAAPAPGRTPSFGGFARFVREQGLWLVLITLLMALPTVVSLVKRGLAVFVPYR
jgi:hypothetical protein